MFCMEKCDWGVTDESADDYNGMFDLIDDIIQNRRDPRIVFDLNVTTECSTPITDRST